MDDGHRKIGFKIERDSHEEPRFPASQVRQFVSDARRVGITAGIVLTVLVGLVLLGIVAVVWWAVKKAKPGTPAAPLPAWSHHLFGLPKILPTA